MRDNQASPEVRVNNLILRASERFGAVSWLLALLCLINATWLIWQSTSRLADMLGGFGLGLGVMLLTMGRLMHLLIKAIGQQQTRNAR